MIDSQRNVPITNIEDAQKMFYKEGMMMDILGGLSKLEPQRDREILRALLLDDEEPQSVAERYGVSVDNLYNIKRRAIARLIQKHLKDYDKKD